MRKALRASRADGALLDESVRLRRSIRCLGRRSAVTDDAGFAIPWIEALPSRQVTASKPMLGAVTVAPLHAATARSVRLELVFDEHLPTRPREPLKKDCDATAVVAAVPPVKQVRVEPRPTLRLPCTPRWASS
jgi:hypothetical protein